MAKQSDREWILSDEASAAWFKAHPGAKDDGATVHEHRGAAGHVTYTKRLGRIEEPIDRAQYMARSWRDAEKKRKA